MSAALERLILPWQLKGEILNSPISLKDQDMRELHTYNMWGSMVAKVWKASSYCYLIHCGENKIAFNNSYTSFEAAKEACELRLKELGIELISEERAEKLRMLL